MGIGSYAGGILYDRLGWNAWLYSGSFVIGALAVSLGADLPSAAPCGCPGGGACATR